MMSDSLSSDSTSLRSDPGNTGNRKIQSRSMNCSRSASPSHVEGLLPACDPRPSETDTEAATSEAGMTKARELVTVARPEGNEFGLCTLGAQNQGATGEELEREVERYLNVKDTEPWEIILFQTLQGPVAGCRA